MGEFVEPAIFERRFAEVVAYKNRLLEMFGSKPLEFAPTFERYVKYAERLKPFVEDTEILAQDAVAAGHRVLFEGAQGTYLDLDSGTYPYVTSSHPVAGGACLGTGVGPRDIDNVLGVCKAYTTRVGSGPFPTELDDEIGARIREQGQEYGTVTGRGRRCGWLDLVALRHSARLNSLSGLVVTRLDVLQGIGRLKVATGYRVDGNPVRTLPANVWDLAKVQAEYEELEGWDDDLRPCRRFEDLPTSVRNYLAFVEEYTKTPVAIVSIGPDRDETIIVRPELIWA
jgi:adenylosuccinate synthase